MHNVHLEADERISQRDGDVRIQVITLALKLRMSAESIQFLNIGNGKFWKFEDD